jgi:hypothetical protein
MPPNARSYSSREAVEKLAAHLAEDSPVEGDRLAGPRRDVAQRRTWIARPSA